MSYVLNIKYVIGAKYLMQTMTMGAYKLLMGYINYFL